MTNDDGATWSKISPQGINLESSDLAASSPFTDGSRLFVESPGVILESRDGGQTWNKDVALAPGNGSLFAVTPDDTFYLKSNDGSTLRAKEDDKSWITIAPPATDAFGNLHAAWDIQGHPLAVWVTTLSFNSGNYVLSLQYHAP
jgi:photosystem II stability/assembly factor-like uncharacterized protein